MNEKGGINVREGVKGGTWFYFLPATVGTPRISLKHTRVHRHVPSSLFFFFFFFFKSKLFSSFHSQAEPKVTRRKGERVEHELRKTKVKEPRSMSTISSVSPVLFGRHGGVGAARVLSLSHSHFAWREGGGGEGGSISKPVAARMTESAPRLPRSLRT